jgi:hypothetical protein
MTDDRPSRLRADPSAAPVVQLTSDGLLAQRLEFRP